jgi:hypothetical protein
MIFVLSFPDGDVGDFIGKQLRSYVSTARSEDYFVCFRFSTSRTCYADVYRHTQALNSQLPSSKQIFSSKISSMKLLEVSGPTSFDRDLFSKLMQSASYIVSITPEDSTTQKSITLLKGMQQVGNTSVKVIELEFTNAPSLSEELLILPPANEEGLELTEETSELDERTWEISYSPMSPGKRGDFASQFVDVPLTDNISDISTVLKWIRYQYSQSDMSSTSIENKRKLLLAGKELTPLVSDLHKAKSQYQSTDANERDVNQLYKGIENLWRHIWSGH